MSRIYDIFKRIDEGLTNLGKSDSSIEYASHIREHFNYIVDSINGLKYELNLGKEVKNSNEYFQ